MGELNLNMESDFEESQTLTTPPQWVPHGCGGCGGGGGCGGCGGGGGFYSSIAFRQNAKAHNQCVSGHL